MHANEAAVRPARLGPRDGFGPAARSHAGGCAGNESRPRRCCAGGRARHRAADLTNVAPGSSGSFDVLLVDTDPLGSTMTYKVAEDNFELTLTGAAGFTFTNATINTSATYIYVQSTDGFLGSPLSLNTFPNTDFIASDEEFASPYYRTLTPQAVFGLASVSYSVASTASGTAMLTIVDANTGLTELDGITSIPFTVINGSISTASIPEPSTLVLATTPLVIGLCAAWRRHRRRR